MYNLESEMKKFYYNEVVLPSEEKNKLREKKKYNIDRLKEGLEEYNEENKTDYKIAETIEQGSVAMSTVIQNDKNDYDIDVAIVFDSNNINNIGSIAIKNIVVDALKRKCTNFKKEPEAKTNCVRIEYADNYHIDFAIYKRIKIFMIKIYLFKIVIHMNMREVNGEQGIQEQLIIGLKTALRKMEKKLDKQYAY